jgi:uncharacterized OB-fold protein
MDPFFAERAPYIVADIKLAEGPHMTSTVVDRAPQDVAIGDAVSVEFDPASEAIHLPVFRRVG